jgi:ATPase associated with various cellular activities AAA_5
MTAEDLFKIVRDKAEAFGMSPKNEGQQIKGSTGNAIIRTNLQSEAFTSGAAYFGFLNPEEETSGPYSDFSFVVFPDSVDNVTTCVVCLAVGSSGFRNDYQLAALPGLRRMFLKLKGQNTFFKASFDDIESTSTDLLKKIPPSQTQLASVIKKYKTVLPASCIVNPQEEKGIKTIYAWLATYAKIRSWGTKEKLRKEIEDSLPSIPSTSGPNEEQKVKDLLKKRKYVVLQGAPGTGKTYTALNIANTCANTCAKTYDKIFFEQFHAETTFSDFVYGIEPNMSEDMSQPQFTAKKGVLYQAIEYAKEKEKEKVLLIIDEINRANLSNVLGPVFYLFEYQSGMRNVEISVGDMKLTKLPDNLYVIATMNTADRSLAVVDFALRRRFAWYTLRPHEITPGSGKKFMFMKDSYNKFADIFFQYATDDELNLQPGQSYFIVSKQTQEKEEEEMKERMIYELMPLIKEYLAEGYLLKAKDAFCDLFLKETEKLMYE